MGWIAIVVSPLFLLIGGIIGAWINNRFQEAREAEARLSGDIRRVYGELMKPYYHVFSSPQGAGADEAIRIMSAPEYKATAFDFMMVAPDNAARAYNELQQYIYRMGGDSVEQGRKVLLLWGQLLLEIRKSLGHKDTQLENVDMLRSLIKDIETLVDHKAQLGDS
ncbi:MAG: hypothetical protein WEE64_16005 [Dehalococcoidia bacterium]